MSLPPKKKKRLRKRKQKDKWMGANSVFRDLMFKMKWGKKKNLQKAIMDPQIRSGPNMLIIAEKQLTFFL